MPLQTDCVGSVAAKLTAGSTVQPAMQVAEDDSGVLSLCVVAKLLGVPANSDHLRRGASQPARVDTTTLVRLAGQVALKARVVNTRSERLAHTPLPAVAQLCNGTFVVLLKCAGAAVLVHDASRQQCVEMPLAEFGRIWSGRLVLVTSRTLLAQGGGVDPFEGRSKNKPLRHQHRLAEARLTLRYMACAQFGMSRTLRHAVVRRQHLLTTLACR